MTTRRSLVQAGIAVLAIALFVVPAPAQEDESAVRLSLEDCVATALERNLDIAIARINPQSARESITVAEAAFEPLIGATGSYGEVEQEPTSTFSLTEQSTTSLGGRYTDPLRSGGEWYVELGYNERDASYPEGSAALFGLVPLNVGAALTVSVSQPLLRGFGLEINRTQIEQATNDLRISEAQFEDRVMEIVESVESSYWNLVGARRELEVARQSLTLAEDFLRQTKIKVDVGTVPPIEITTAEAEVAGREEGLINAEKAVESAADALRALIRVPAGSPDWFRPLVPVDKPVFNVVSPDLEEALETALSKRSSILEAQINVKNAELTERYQRNQLKWDLSANASYTTTGNNFEYLPVTVTRTIESIDWFGPDGVYNSGDVSLVTVDVDEETFVREDGSRGDAFSELPDLDNTNWSVSLNLTIPVGNKAAKAEHVRARLALDQAALSLDAAKQALRIEVRQAVRDVETANRKVKSARANVTLQQKKTDAAQKRYENGLLTAYDVLQFQRDYLASEVSLIEAVIEYMQALSHLERVKGSLLEARMIQLD